MEHIGEYLINSRMEKELSREDISRLTKIPLKFVSALEDEDFDVLPQHVYIRGFIRTYCKEVGITPDPVLSRLNEILAPETPKRVVENGTLLGRPSPMMTTKNPKHRSRMGISLVLLFVVLGLLFGILALTQKTGMQDMSRATNPTHNTYPATTNQGIEDTGRYFF